jgi:hypothetical protein
MRSYDFINFDASKYDICFEIDYHSTKIMGLNVLYNHSGMGQKDSFRLPLSLGDSKLDFCLRDFLFHIQENFTVSFQFNGDSSEIKWDESPFILNNLRFENIAVQSEKTLRYIHNREVNLSNATIFDKQLKDTNGKWKYIPKRDNPDDNISPFKITFKGSKRKT